MKVILASIHTARGRAKSSAAEELFQDYTARIARYMPLETNRFAAEDELFAWIAKQTARAPIYMVLLDSRGVQLDSTAFAERLRALQDRGTQQVLFAIGPADGWSAAAGGRANLIVSLGPMTLPHELARVVLAEQIYRACTILAGHPYHCGH